MQTVGPYTLLTTLGTCPLGSVWAGTDPGGGEVRIAVMDAQAARDAENRGKFAAAAKALAQFKMPILGSDFDAVTPWVACAPDNGPGPAQIFIGLGERITAPGAAAAAEPLPRTQALPLLPSEPAIQPTSGAAPASGSPWNEPPKVANRPDPAQPGQVDAGPAQPTVGLGPAAQPTLGIPAPPAPQAAGPMPMATGPGHASPGSGPAAHPQPVASGPPQTGSAAPVGPAPGPAAPSAPSGPVTPQPTYAPAAPPPGPVPVQPGPPAVTPAQAVTPPSPPHAGAPQPAMPGYPYQQPHPGAPGYPAAQAPVAGGGAVPVHMPPGGVPASGVPASGMPASGMPASGMPASHRPASGMPAPSSGVPVFDDPWAGYPGPTSGYPHPAPGYPGPVSGVPRQYSGGPYAATLGADPEPRKRRTGLWIGIAALVLVLVGGGGAALAYGLNHKDTPSRTLASASPTPSAKKNTTPAPTASQPGVEPPKDGSWPAKWPQFAQGDDSKRMSKLEGVFFNFSVPKSWECSLADQSDGYVRYSCGTAPGDAQVGGELVVRKCPYPCDADRRVEWRKREEAWGLQWVRAGSFVTWAESSKVGGADRYGFIMVAYARSSPDQAIDRQIVLRLTAPPDHADEVRRVANSIHDTVH